MFRTVNGFKSIEIQKTLAVFFQHSILGTTTYWWMACFFRRNEGLYRKIDLFLFLPLLSTLAKLKLNWIYHFLFHIGRKTRYKSLIGESELYNLGMYFEPIILPRIQINFWSLLITVSVSIKKRRKSISVYERERFIEKIRGSSLHDQKGDISNHLKILCLLTQINGHLTCEGTFSPTARSVKFRTMSSLQKSIL